MRKKLKNTRYLEPGIGRTIVLKSLGRTISRESMIFSPRRAATSEASKRRGCVRLPNPLRDPVTYIMGPCHLHYDNTTPVGFEPTRGDPIG